MQQNNTLRLAFASHASLDVRSVSARERMSELFTVRVVAVSTDDNLDLDSVVGRGAAVRVHMPSLEPESGTRVWAGICADIVQTHSESQGVSEYHALVVPTFWRTTLRRNSRIFQHMTTPAIIQKVLAEWQITPVMKLTAAYKAHEYRVQYAETDYAFISRLLEDAGIAFYFRFDATAGRGEDITRLVLDDAPQVAAQRPGPLPYIGHKSEHVAGSAFCASVALTRKLKAGAFTLRDFDFRLRPDTVLAAKTRSGGDEDAYEVYDYAPGVFSWEPGPGGDTPAADDKGVARSDSVEGAAIAKRRLESERRARLGVSFQTNAVDLCPGTVVGINQNADTRPHPRPDLAPDKTILLVESSFDGASDGAWTMSASGVFAELAYRPERSTPRPKIVGVQSAVVVGPSGQDIHTDEFGRVRVQFPWDREGKYNENSSCWMRVSQAWAGGGFGTIMVPRIGHEVLVEFFEGDPDKPVIVGRVYNATTPTPYKLPENGTQSGWKSDSSPGGGGYNEIKFEDKNGSEVISVQAQKDLAYVVNNSETSNIGASRAARIGTFPHGSDSLNVGMSRTTSVGVSDTSWVGMTHSITVGETVGTRMTSLPGQIVLSTGRASIKLVGPNIFMNAEGEIHLHAGKEIHVSSQAGTIIVQGGPNVEINPSGSGEKPEIDKVSPGAPPMPASHGNTSGPPFKPSGGGSIPLPGGIEDVIARAEETTT